MGPTRTFEELVRRCSSEEVRATTHALLLRLAREGVAESFPVEMRGALIVAMKEAGVTPDTTWADWDRALDAFVASQPVRADLLEGLHAQVMNDRSTEFSSR